MKAVSWVLVSALALALFILIPQLPDPTDPTAILSIHTAARYVQDSAGETGIPSATLAVVADYRSFALFLICFIFGLAAMVLGGMDPDGQRGPVLSLLSTMTGLLGAVLLASCGPWQGARFLELDPLTHWFRPEQASLWGASWLVASAMVCVLGMVLGFWSLYRSLQEGPDGE